MLIRKLSSIPNSTHHDTLWRSYTFRSDKRDGLSNQVDPAAVDWSGLRVSMHGNCVFLASDAKRREVSNGTDIHFINWIINIDSSHWEFQWLELSILLRILVIRSTRSVLIWTFQSSILLKQTKVMKRILSSIAIRLATATRLVSRGLYQMLFLMRMQPKIVNYVGTPSSWVSVLPEQCQSPRSTHLI